jgi:hypothetical protein
MRSDKGRPAKRRAKWVGETTFISHTDRRPFTSDKFTSNQDYWDLFRWDRVAYILITAGLIILWVTLGGK